MSNEFTFFFAIKNIILLLNNRSHCAFYNGHKELGCTSMSNTIIFFFLL